MVERVLCACGRGCVRTVFPELFTDLHQVRSSNDAHRYMLRGEWQRRQGQS